MKRKNDLIPFVEVVEKIKEEEIKEILNFLKIAVSRKGVQKMLVPAGFFVFKFWVKLSADDILKDGKEKNLIFEAITFDEAIKQLKEKLKDAKENYFKGFMVFYSNDDRWRILETKEKKAWHSKGYIIATKFSII